MTTSDPSNPRDDHDEAPDEGVSWDALFGAFQPIREWYDNEDKPRSLVDMLRDAVRDLQTDRAGVIRLRNALRDASSMLAFLHGAFGDRLTAGDKARLVKLHFDIREALWPEENFGAHRKPDDNGLRPFKARCAPSSPNSDSATRRSISDCTT